MRRQGAVKSVQTWRAAIVALILLAVTLVAGGATCQPAPESPVLEDAAERLDTVTPTASSTKSPAPPPNTTPTADPTASSVATETPVPEATPTLEPTATPAPTATANPIPAVTATPTATSAPCPTAAEEEYLSWLSNDLLVYSEAAVELGNLLTIFEVNPQLGFTEEFKLAFDRPADRLRRAARNITDLFPISGRIATGVHTIAARMARTTIDSVNLFAEAIDTRDADKLEEADLLFAEEVLPDILALGWAIEHFCESSSPQATPQSVPTASRAVEPSPTATAAPAPKPTSKPVQSLTVAGSGTDALEVTLAGGLWTLHMEVSENSDCVLGTCVAALFAVEVESVSGTGYELAANTIAEDWQGRVAFRLGSELLDLAPGKQVVSVAAASTSEWTLTFQPTSGTATTGGT